MRMMAVAFAAWMLSLPALAESIELGQVAAGSIYYNRPGAQLDQHNADLKECFSTSPSVQLGYEQGLVFNMVWSGPIAGLRMARVENCMLVKGWRAVRVSDAEAGRLHALSASAFTAALAETIGAAAPSGEEVRAFNNDAYSPGSYSTASRPRQPSRDHLSLKLYQLSGTELPTPEPGAVPKVQLDPKWPVGPLKIEQISAAPPGSAIVLARVTGISNRYGISVGFAREGATPDEHPSRLDHAPDHMFAGIGFLYAKKEGNWFVLAVPPGRWRISSSGFLNYCLGAPSFEVKAGEVVYAGTFHLEGPKFGPDLDLAPAQAVLGGDLGGKIRPASYRNGSTQTCEGLSVTYALEIPGAPFDPNYRWGSIAKSVQ